MKTSSAQLKLRARKTLLGRYGTAIGAEFAVYGISMGVTFVMEIILMAGTVSAALTGNPRVVGGITAVFAMVMYLLILMVNMLIVPGVLRMYLNMCTGQNARVGDIFFAFKNHLSKFIGITLGLGLISVVFMIPGFVLAFASARTGDFIFAVVFMIFYSILITVISVYAGLTYGMVYIILVEDPEKGILEALSESRRLMKGNRGRYFYLGLSFIGWIFLTYLSFGMGFLWLYPYIVCTAVQFYLDLKPQVVEYPPQWQTDPEGWQQSQADVNIVEAVETVDLSESQI